MSKPLRLSTASRRALRRAITDHAGWTSPFRNRHNLSLATMGRDDYIRVAEMLEIDVAAIVAETEGDKAAAARDVFADTARAAADEAKARLGENSREFERADALANEAAKVGRELVKRNAERDAADYMSDYNSKKAEAARNAFTAETTEKEKALMSENNSAVASQLAALLAQLSSTTVDESKVREIVEREISTALEKHAGPVVRIEVTDAGLPFNEVKGRQHPEFAKMLRAAAARAVDGYCPNIWIAGPAGSGKTYAVSKIAETLEVPFHFNGAIGMPHELLGFVDAGGTYHRTAFREAYEHGGCYLFDEVDGSDNSALLALNAALANGRATFPDGVIVRHKDCRIFAAANTWGFGATAEYVGRAKLDAAFLSRFPVRIMWSYDDALEADICGHPDAARMVQRARRAAADLGLKVLITPRDSIACAALVASGFTLTDAAEMTYLAAMSAEQRVMLENKLMAR